MATDMDLVIKLAGQQYRLAEPKLTCPSMEDLCGLYLADLSQDKNAEFAQHIATCEGCTLSLKKIETEWIGLKLLRQDLIQQAFDKAVHISKKSVLSRAGEMVSTIKEELIVWVSSLWTPVWGTATSNEPQTRNFEMGGGEYIKLSCYWQGSGEGSPAFIHLEWSANILSSSRLWLRLSDPETHELLYEELLGDELTGERDLNEKDLSFDPSRRRWTISILVVEA